MYIFLSEVYKTSPYPFLVFSPWKGLVIYFAPQSSKKLKLFHK